MPTCDGFIIAQQWYSDEKHLIGSKNDQCYKHTAHKMRASRLCVVYCAVSYEIEIGCALMCPSPVLSKELTRV